MVSGGSYYSQNSLTLYLGVGKAETIDRIQVRWPGSDTQTWSNFRPNRTLQITEGKD